MEIGRKIYYELSTGNVIYTTELRDGYVLETTKEQDFTSYKELTPYNLDSVGVIQLDYGQYEDNINKYPYHVDISQNPPIIVWDTANPIGASLADVQNAKIAQLNDMYNQCLDAGFTATIGTTSHTFGWSTNDKANLNATDTAVAKGFATFPINYADVHGNTVVLNAQADLDTLEQTATKFAFAQHQQILNLIGQVKSQTTNANGEVDAIQWTPATY